jgi:hypothetical protein
LALQYHHERSQERYSAIYNAIGSDLSTLVSQMQRHIPDLLCQTVLPNIAFARIIISMDRLLP